MKTTKSDGSFSVQPFEGDGLTPEFSSARWDAIRDEIYRDHDFHAPAHP
jgi:hypothetical protein